MTAEWREQVSRVLHALRWRGMRGPIVIVGNAVQWFFDADSRPHAGNDNTETKA